jgi:hypothetical protein
MHQSVRLLFGLFVTVLRAIVVITLRAITIKAIAILGASRGGSPL